MLRPGLTGDTAGESRSDADDHIIRGPGRQLHWGWPSPTSGVRPHVNHRPSSRNLPIERGVCGAKGADRNCSLSPSGDGDDRDGPLADMDRGPVRVRPRWRERYGRMVDRRRACRDHRRRSRTCPSRPARRPAPRVRQHTVVASVPRSDPRPAVLASGSASFCVTGSHATVAFAVSIEVSLDALVGAFAAMIPRPQ